MTLKAARRAHEIAVHNGPHVMNQNGDLEPIRLTGKRYAQGDSPYLCAYSNHGFTVVHESDIVYRWPRRS